MSKKKLRREELITVARKVDDATCDLGREDFEAVLRIVGGLRSAFSPAGQESVIPASNGGSWDDIARRFAGFVSTAAARGNPGQKNAMLIWLKSDKGEIELSKLWNAAGVKTQHDYAGIGSSLTRNMQKAKGPKEWYHRKRLEDGRRIYKVMPDLLAALRRAFGIDS